MPLRSAASLQTCSTESVPTQNRDSPWQLNLRLWIHRFNRRECAVACKIGSFDTYMSPPRVIHGFSLHSRSTYTPLDPRSLKTNTLFQKTAFQFNLFLSTFFQPIPKSKHNQTKSNRQDAIQRRHCPCRHGLHRCCPVVCYLSCLMRIPDADMCTRTVYVTVPCSTSSIASSGVASPTVVASTGVKTPPTPTGSPISYATGAASMNAVSGSALGMIIAGGVALVSSVTLTC